MNRLEKIGKIIVTSILMVSMLGTTVLADENKTNTDAEVKIVPLDISGYSDKIEELENMQLYNLEIASDSNASPKQTTGVNASRHYLDKTGKYVYPGSPVVCIMIDFDSEANDIYTNTRYNSLSAEDKKHYSSNAKAIGSGVLIGPDTVLTCAHIFYPDVVKTDTSFLGKKTYTEYTRSAKIDTITVGTQVQDSMTNTSTLCHEVNLSSDFINMVEGIEERVGKKDYSLLKLGNEESFNCDFAILKLDNSLGDDAGWVGMYNLNKSGGFYGTVYGYPDIAPVLPNVNDLKDALIKDASLDETVDKPQQFKGKAIYIKDVISDVKDARTYDKDADKNIKDETYAEDEEGTDKGEENKPKVEEHRYSKLIPDLNDYLSLYSSRSALMHDKDNVMKYRCSTQEGQSGGPIIVSVYNNDTKKVEYFTSGIHCGYSFENWDPSNAKKFGDMQMYVRDIWDNPIDFNKEHAENEQQDNRWRSTIEMFGYNRGREIDGKLYNCIIDKGWSDGKPHVPES